MSDTLNVFAMIGTFFNLIVAINITWSPILMMVCAVFIILNIFNIVGNANEIKSLRKENKGTGGYIALSVISGVVGILLTLILAVYFFNHPLPGNPIPGE